MTRNAFTDRAIAALKVPRTGQADSYDARTPGLGIRVSYGGSKTWFLKYQTPDKRQRRTKLGKYPEMSLADARTAALDFKHELVVEKTDPADRARRERGAPTFRELTEDYLSWVKGKLDDNGIPMNPRKRSWREDERILITNTDYFGPFRVRKAVEIERAELVDRLQEISRRNGGVQANRCLAAVRRLYNWGYRAGGISPHNPAHMIERPHREQPRDRVYTSDELGRLWEAFGRQGIAGHAFRFAMATGQRIGEIVAVKWADIDDGPNGDGQAWTISSAQYKTRRTHTVPLSPLALRVLEDVPKTNGVNIFASPRIADQPVTIGGKLRAASRKLSGVEDFEPHDMRRTLATNAGPLGFPPHIADRLLGHVQNDISSVYNRHSYSAEKRELAEAWGRHLEGIIGEGGNVVSLGRTA